MGWSLYLRAPVCPSCHRSEDLGEWTCTYNLNAMLREAGLPNAARDLDKQDGATVFERLEPVIALMEAEPERFRALNPPNGWGSYDDLMPVLREIRDKCKANPSAQTTGWF